MYKAGIAEKLELLNPRVYSGIQTGTHKKGKFMPATFAQIKAGWIIAAAGSNTRKIVSTYYYNRNNTVLPLSKGNIAAAFDVAMNTSLLLASVSRMTQEYIGVRFIEDYTDAEVQYAYAGVGALGTDSLPDGCTVTVELQTGLRGGSYRGWKRYPGVAEASTTGDVLTGGGLTLWQAVRDAAGATFTDADGNVWSPWVVSQKLSTLNAPVTNVVAYAVNSVVLNKNIGYMKRRRPTRVI